MKPAKSSFYAMRVLFISLPVIFIAVGGWMAHRQERAMRTFQPTSAIILSRRIKSHSGDKSTTYSPEANYRYTVSGQEYECNSVTMMKESAGYDWARQRLDRLPDGDAVTAYYNPADPADAFLLREVSFFPYIFVLGPMIFVCVALAARPTQETSRLQAPKSLVLVAIVWNAAGAIVAAHYFYSGGILDLTSKIALSLYGLVGLLLMYSAVYLRINEDAGAIDPSV